MNLMGIDMGTTSVKTVLFNESLRSLRDFVPITLLNQRVIL